MSLHGWVPQVVSGSKREHSSHPSQAEEAVKAQGFAYTTILRPGLLARGAKARTAERAFSLILKGVSVSQVAHVAVQDSTSFLEAKGEGKPTLRIVENGEIKKWKDA